MEYGISQQINATNSTTSVDVGTFQTVFWMGVIFIVAFLFAIYLIAYMEFTQDPLLYRTLMQTKKTE